MSATLAVAGKEWREALRAGWLIWAGLAIAALVLAASLSAGVARSEASRTLAAVEAQEAHTWLNQGARNPHAAAHFSRYAVRPYSALDDIDPGVHAFVGGFVWMEAHLQRPAEARPAEDRADLSPIGALTPAWIVQQLGALIALLIGSAAIAREREEGRLGLLQASGADMGALMWGKFLGAGGLAVAIGAVVIVAGAAGPCLQLIGGGGLYPDAALRLGAWTGAALLYVAIFAALGLALSAAFSTARAAMLAAIALWGLTNLAVPQASAVVADALAPSPSPAAFTARLHDEVGKALDRDEANRTRSDAPTIVDEQGRVLSVRGMLLQRGEEVGDVVYDRLYAELNAIYARQTDVRAMFAIASPLVAFQSLSAGLNGGDLPHHAHFLRQAEDTRRIIIRQLNEDDMYNAGDRGGAYEADSALWARIPRFSYAPPALGEVDARYGRDAFALALWLAAALMLAWVSAQLALRRR